MLKIYLVRHGQSRDNQQGILGGHRDEPLTELGEIQAKNVAQYFQEQGIVFDYVATSPFVRAYRTTEIITEALKLPKPHVVADLMERDFGVMTGERESTILERCAPNVISTKDTTYFLTAKGAEPFPQVGKRVRKILNSLYKRYNNGTILLVTHGDVGKMLYATFYQLDWKEVLQLVDFHHGDVLLLAPIETTEESFAYSQPAQKDA